MANFFKKAIGYPRKRLRQSAKRRLDRTIAAKTFMVPALEHDPQDIFIVGYPKSGHTWFQNLLAGLVYGADPTLLPMSAVSMLIPNVDMVQYYRRISTPMYFKTHTKPRPDIRRAVYLIRDGRDAMVSLRHYMEGVHSRPVDLMKLVLGQDPDMPIGWDEHVHLWLSNPHACQMLIVKYEDLKRDAAGQMELFCRFAGLSRTRAQIDEVVGRSDFKSMQKKESQSGIDDPNWPKDKRFVRRGEVGSFRDEMPPDALAAFLNRAGPILQQCGYKI